MTTPQIVRTVAELRTAVAAARRAGKTVGLVPTMGALHPGHVSLVASLARKTCGFTVVTIFVNPTQFGPKEDFAKYPRPFDADVAAVGAAGADLRIRARRTTKSTRRAMRRTSRSAASPSRSKGNVGPGTFAASPPLC